MNAYQIIFDKNVDVENLHQIIKAEFFDTLTDDEIRATNLVNVPTFLIPYYREWLTRRIR